MTRASLICTEPPHALASLRRSFDARHAVRLPGFLDADLVSEAHRAIRQAIFHDHDDGGIARERRMSDDALLALMRLIMNDSRLFELIRRISGCGPITYLDGRVYAFQSGSDHHDSWHSDASGDRQVGISINLSDGEFEGGIFELRHAASDAVEWSSANAVPGDAILFRISEDLCHRVTAVTGPVPRVVYAGWFQGGPDLLTVLKRAGGSAEDAHRRLQYTDQVPTT